MGAAFIVAKKPSCYIFLLLSDGARIAGALVAAPVSGFEFEGMFVSRARCVHAVRPEIVQVNAPVRVVLAVVDDVEQPVSYSAGRFRGGVREEESFGL